MPLCSPAHPLLALIFTLIHFVFPCEKVPGSFPWSGYLTLGSRKPSLWRIFFRFWMDVYLYHPVCITQGFFSSLLLVCVRLDSWTSEAR